MRFLFITLFFLSEVSLAGVTLNSTDAEKVLRKIQACANDECWNEALSNDTSKLEKARTRDWLKAFKIRDSKNWSACQFKLRKLAEDEVCFAQQEDSKGENEVRIFFKYEDKTWRLKHLSLPSPALGW